MDQLLCTVLFVPYALGAEATVDVQETDGQPPVVSEELERLRRIKLEIDRGDTYIGESVPILRVFERIKLLNRLPDYPVLLVGQTGSGKTRIAELIHDSSKRRDEGPFKYLQATQALGHDERSTRYKWEGYGPKTGFDNLREDGSPGFLRECEGGTIFLDEVADLPEWFQTYLLQILDRKPLTPEGEREKADTSARTRKKKEDGGTETPEGETEEAGVSGRKTKKKPEPVPVASAEFVPDVRFVFATNKIPADMTKGELPPGFRHDLYDRFARRTIEIPPLRGMRFF
jgi:transcriptional regulator with AAA-type ATPase domain